MFKEIYEFGILVKKVNLRTKKSMIKNDSLFNSEIDGYEFNRKYDLMEAEFRRKLEPKEPSKVKLSHLGRYNSGHSMSSIFSTVKSNHYDTVSMDEYKQQLDSFMEIVERDNIEEWTKE